MEKIPKSYDSVKIRGIVEIINGDKKIVAENKFVQSMVVWLANMTSISQIWNEHAPLSNWDVYLGIDTNTTTKYNTTALTTPIGTAPGTVANIKTGSTSNPSNGVFRVTFTTTWNPATLGSATVGEMALYFSIRGILQGFGWVTDGTETKQLASRLAVADGAFTAFTINPVNPVTVNWTIQYSFA